MGNNQIKVYIETGEPGIVMGKAGIGLDNLLKNIKKILLSDRQLTITIIEIENVDLNATLLADLVSKQLEKRVAFRRAIRDTLQRAQKQNVNGIKYKFHVVLMVPKWLEVNGCVKEEFLYRLYVLILIMQQKKHIQSMEFWVLKFGYLKVRF